uniref:U3 small nucleolar RNA-associated protein 14 A n=1 Tax=Ascaris suum TaxID=6253 RepID=F1KV50_ASCSU
MSDVIDPDYNQEAHEKLIKTIQAIGRTKATSKRGTVKKKVKKVSAGELIGAIHSTRNLDDIKKELQKKKNADKKGKGTTLSAPLHRLANERIHSSVAYSEAKRDLAVWAPVVQENRLADQLVFPIEQNEAVDQSGTERLQNFKPRTSLELEMANILGTSKNTLPNEKLYTEAEMELLKAMSLEEAKAKCAKLQKMRALVSYREAKLRRQAKIKSKSYHRHLKRQKRKQLIKEFDELLLKDPEASKEKLAEIERQRILERATLKHRNGSKRIQMLARHASKDTNAKRALEEQIRLGRELVEKHGMESDSDSDNDGADVGTENALNPQLLLEKAAEIAAQEETLETSESNPALRVSLRRLRQEQKISSEKTAATAQQALVGRHNLRADGATRREMEMDSEKIWEEDATWDVTRDEVPSSQEPIENTDAVREQERVETVSSGSIRKRKLEVSEKKEKKKKKKKKVCETSANVEELFDNAEQRLIELTTKEAELIRHAEKNVEAHDADNTTHIVDCVENLAGKDTDDVFNGVRNAGAMKTAKRKMEEEERHSVQEIDILLDPRHFLKAETSAITQVSADLMERVDDFEVEAEQEALVAAAFEDDDVIGDFEAEKSAVEEREKPKDLDLTLQGWGSWTGPGIASKKKDRFVIKAEKKKRKDQGRNGLIISEAVDSSIDKVQPHSVPFPYTTVEDYEAVVRQPIGKEWNPQRIHQKLIKPAVLTRAGRIIRPLDKEVALKEHFKEISDELT